MQNWIVFDISTDGHRKSYIEVLRKKISAFDGQKVVVEIGPLSRDRFFRLLGAQRLICLTIDDYFLLFMVLCFIRAFLGRKTWGISIRLLSLFQTQTAKRSFKKFFLRILMKTPGCRIVSITPFEQEPRLQSFAHFSLLDIQYWDLPYHDHQTFLNDPLSERIQKLRSGRQVVMSLGRQDPDKGTEFLTKIYQDLEIQKKFLFVVIGELRSAKLEWLEDFQKNGGLWINEYISDEILLRAYQSADLIWTCYHPQYDQSSGIFGRAIQLGKQTIVRRGSQLEKSQKLYRQESISIPWMNIAKAKEIFLNFEHQNQHLDVLPTGPTNFVEIFELN